MDDSQLAPMDAIVSTTRAKICRDYDLGDRQRFLVTFLAICFPSDRHRIVRIAYLGQRRRASIRLSLLSQCQMLSKGVRRQ